MLRRPGHRRSSQLSPEACRRAETLRMSEGPRGRGEHGGRCPPLGLAHSRCSETLAPDLLQRPFARVRLSRVPKKPLPAGAAPAAALTCADGSLPLPVRLAAELGASGFCRRLHRRSTTRARLRDSEGSRRPLPRGAAGTQPPPARSGAVSAPRREGARPTSRAPRGGTGSGSTGLSVPL